MPPPPSPPPPLPPPGELGEAPPPSDFFVLSLTLAQDVAEVRPHVPQIMEALADELQLPRSYVSLLSILSASTLLNFRVARPDPETHGTDVQAIANDLSIDDIQSMLDAAGLPFLKATADAQVTVFSPPPSPPPGVGGDSDGDGEDRDVRARAPRRLRQSLLGLAPSNGASCACPHPPLPSRPRIAPHSTQMPRSRLRLRRPQVASPKAAPSRPASSSASSAWRRSPAAWSCTAAAVRQETPIRCARRGEGLRESPAARACRLPFASLTRAALACEYAPPRWWPQAPLYERAPQPVEQAA